MFGFYSDCVGWPSNDIAGLTQMIADEIPITRKTFLKHVDRVELKWMEAQLGYGPGTCFKSMGSDWHISYHRSKLHGERVYYFQHSGIEYVFVEMGD